MTQKSKNKKLCILKLKRSTDGVDLYVQSAALERFFSEGNVEKNWVKGNVQYYPCIETFKYIKQIADTRVIFTNVKVLSDWIPFNMLDLSWLRIKNIGMGRNLHFPGVYTKADLTTWLENVTKALQYIWKTYIKDVEIIATLEEVK